MKRPSQSQLIILGLMVGIVVGAIVSRVAPARADLFRPFAALFLRLIKMIVAPLIFSSLVAGIGGAAAHGKPIGRMGFRAIVYFEIVTALALVVGLAAVNLTHPGVGVVLPPPGEAPTIEAPRRRGTASSCTPCRSRLRRRWRRTTSCRS